MPAISHVESYARIVRDKYELRTLMQAARGILSDASAGEQETSLLLDSAEKRIYDIRRGKSDAGLQPVRVSLLEPATSTRACPRALRSWTTPSPA